jgi:RHS repeat-associated protein
MQLASGTHIPDGLLAANSLLAENSRQGFGTWSGTVHQGFGFVISHTSLGIKGSLYDGRIRSRSTGKERDTESGLDDFGARYYASNLGRFMSSDWDAKPVAVPYANFGDPQTLNLYSYVENSPVDRVDADGHAPSQGSPTWLGSSEGPCDGGWSIACIQETNEINLGTASLSGESLDEMRYDAMVQATQQSAVENSSSKAQQQVSAAVNGKSVTYTYPDGSTVVLSGTHPYRDNNPGDLTGGHGSIGRDGSFAIYSSDTAGWDALQATLTGKYGNSTIADTMKAFNPPDNGKDPMTKGNDPVKYAATLAAAVGVPVSTRISSLSPGQLATVMVNIGRAEGYNSSTNTAVYTAPPNQ